MQKTNRFLAMFVIGLWLSGCSSMATFTIKVNGYTDPGAPTPVKSGGSFCVIEDQEAKNPLLAKEIKEKITKLLLINGYPVTSFEKADYYLFFGYGIGEQVTSHWARRITTAVSVGGGEGDMAGAAGAVGAAPPLPSGYPGGATPSATLPSMTAGCRSKWWRDPLTGL